MQIVGFLNGKNKNYDYQLTAASRAVMTGGVLGISDLLVTSGSVAAGSALVEVTRSNGQKVLVHFENTDAFPIATTGTVKIYVTVDQAKIDDGTANASDGTGIATIASGASYPASNFIPLASIASGVITDERVAVSLRNVKRKGMTAKRVLIVDASGNETELSGTEGQAVGFDASGNPVAMTPSMNISGLPAATAFSDSDAYVKFDFVAGGNRKVPTPTARQELGAYFFGEGSDGDLSVSSGTTTLAATNEEVFKQYKNLSISSTGILACAGKINHIYVSDTLTISGSWKLHCDGYGAAGGAGPTTATTAGSNWTNGNGIDWGAVSGRDFYAGIGTAASGNGGTSTWGAGGSLGTFKANERWRMIRVSCGGGGGSSGSPYNTAGAGGSGGGGGGILVITANRVNITGGIISANGANGTNGNTSNRGGGGGGGGGSIVLLYGNVISDTWTWQCNGGNGGNSNSNGWYSTGSGGGGGGGWYGITGGNGGNGIIGGGANAGGTPASNSYWTGWTGGAGWWGGGGGGGAPGVYYKAKARIN